MNLPLPLQGGPILAARRLVPDHAVFLITYRTSPTTSARFVVKTESRVAGFTGADKTAVQTSIMLMRQAARGGKGRVLTEAETGAFLQGTRPLLSAEDREFLDDEAKGHGNVKPIWILLGFKDGLIDLRGMVGAPDAAKAAQVLLSLHDEENLDRLGRILATDMFLHNNDRFNFRPNGTGILNFGNVFFVDKGNGDFKIKGLDVFDPSTNTALMSTVVRKGCEKDDWRDERYWSGPLLKDRGRITKVAQNALDSLFKELGEILRGAGYHEPLIRNFRFSQDDTKRVVKGMEAAVVVIKSTCKLRLAQMRQGKVNADGLKSRMKAMGWST
jgi:hypothetical protein